MFVKRLSEVHVPLLYTPVFVVIDRRDLNRLKLGHEATEMDGVLVLAAILEHLHVLHLGRVLVRVEAVRVWLLASIVHCRGIVGRQSTRLIFVFHHLT